MNQFFNAHHSPIGAFASFTLGFPGAKGGIAQELGKPADQNIYIGLEDTDGKGFHALPFFKQSEDKLEDFATLDEKPFDDSQQLNAWDKSSIQRDYQLATDTWKSECLSFNIISPVLPIPDPETASPELLAETLLPVVMIEMEIDNTNSNNARRAFFGYEGNDPYSAMRFLQDSTDDELVGIAQGNSTAIVHCPDQNKSLVSTASGLSIEHILFAKNPAINQFSIGIVNTFMLNVPAKTKQTFRFAVCFHRNGIVTSGLAARYFYNKYYPSIEAVADYAVKHSKALVNKWSKQNDAFALNTLSSDQKFMLIHATRSYYGSTQLLEVDNKPFWVVNEGEYRMMNTFDLTADHLFFELKMNPWVVKNVLDSFVNRYSYTDKVHKNKSQLSEGGLSFCHDMGVANVFSKAGHSSYEVFDHQGLFSHMTCEQLVNWICCASTYTLNTNDWAWAEKHLTIFQQCLDSLNNRDNPEPSLRDGIMSFDSDRTQSEITTYDSLDTSLGQASRNIYLASKTWAAYLLLSNIFKHFSLNDVASIAEQQAMLCSETLCNAMNEQGFIPAVLDHNNQSKIIPLIEGLVFPKVAGYLPKNDPSITPLLNVMKRHLQTVLDNGCTFADGGWKLSSTSDNSWLSKIYLSQYIAESVLEIGLIDNRKKADNAHVKWLTDPKLSYWAWSDQIIAGKISGSKYYPRGVTAWLWVS